MSTRRPPVNYLRRNGNGMVNSFEPAIKTKRIRLRWRLDTENRRFFRFLSTISWFLLLTRMDCTPDGDMGKISGDSTSSLDRYGSSRGISELTNWSQGSYSAESAGSSWVRWSCSSRTSGLGSRHSCGLSNVSVGISLVLEVRFDLRCNRRDLLTMVRSAAQRVFGMVEFTLEYEGKRITVVFGRVTVGLLAWFSSSILCLMVLYDGYFWYRTDFDRAFVEGVRFLTTCDGILQATRLKLG